MRDVGNAIREHKAKLLSAQAAIEGALHELGRIERAIVDEAGRVDRQAAHNANRESVLAGTEPETIKAENIRLRARVEELEKAKAAKSQKPKGVK